LSDHDKQIRVGNFFTGMAAPAGAEDVSTLFDNRQARIERIVSHGHVSAPGFWYDQDGDEWVMLLRGNATLEFDNGSVIQLRAGDYLTIPSHVRHRVARTTDETVWLAVHLLVAP
jgi:cupin 2 domain-containing protein